MDPRVAKFLAQHSVSRREEVEQDVAPFRGLTLEESWREVLAACRVAAWQLAARPDRDEILAEREPPHPSYAEIMKRLRLAR